jgi:hypothetical protein
MELLPPSVGPPRFARGTQQGLGSPCWQGEPKGGGEKFVYSRTLPVGRRGCSKIGQNSETKFKPVRATLNPDTSCKPVNMCRPLFRKPLHGV